MQAGIGLHDSSSALIPYLLSFPHPFVLISTGTWCISLHPFNHTELTAAELKKDCLCYLSWQGSPVKASRLFAGQYHEDQVKRIAAHFQQPVHRYSSITVDKNILRLLLNVSNEEATGKSPAEMLNFHERELHQFENDIIAYHQLMITIAAAQAASTTLVLNGAPVKHIYVDGGFSRNELYMYLLSTHFPDLEIYAANMAQATAIGAALAIHETWNSQSLPEHLISLQKCGLVS